MHNACMQAFRSLARRVCTPRRDLVCIHPRRDRNRCLMYSRDRSRRT